MFHKVIARVLRCVKNRTSAPIGYINWMGEQEVVGHSKARWTVLGVNEGDRRTEITVIETEEYEEDNNSMADDSLSYDNERPDMPDGNWKPLGLKERMAKQQAYMQFTHVDY